MRQTEVGLGRLVRAFIVILDLGEAGTRVDGRALGEVVLVLGTEGVALGILVAGSIFDGEVREVGCNCQVGAGDRDDRAEVNAVALDAVGRVAVRLARREPIYVSGPSGSGKTSTAMQFCARLGIPVVSVTARARMDRRELLGHWALQGGETRWIDGPALLAWKHGWTLLINEFSAAPADMWVSCNDILEGLPLDNGATGELVVPHPMTRVIVTDNTRGHSSEIDEGFFGRQIQDRSVIDRFWHMRMEGLGEAEEASLLAATADQDWLAEFEPEVLDRLFKALARLGADSRAAAQAQAIGFESRAVPLSFRVLSRMRNMMLDAARMPATSDDDPLRRIIRTSLTEALDSTAREAAETLAVTAIGNLIHEMRVSRARMVLKNATGSALKAASV